eukprot:1444403-Pleurochrysis_carterae.AAC.1
MAKASEYYECFSAERKASDGRSVLSQLHVRTHVDAKFDHNESAAQARSSILWGVSLRGEST